MSEVSIIIVEQSCVVADFIRARLAGKPYQFVSVRDPAQFDAALRTRGVIALALIDVHAVGRDATGRERPFWQVLAARSALTMPVVCFSGAPGTPSDTPLFTAPPETVSVADPQDFPAIARVVQEYAELAISHPLLFEALKGALLPSLRGTLQDFSLESVLTLIKYGPHTGLLLLRDGAHTGIVACEDGDVAHALLGATSGKQAAVSLCQWQDARFTFFEGLTLGVHSVRNVMEDLLLESNRQRDEANAFVASLPPQSFVRRVRGYTDLLPGKNLNQAEWEVLSLVDHYHVVSELMARSRAGSLGVMQALRKLLKMELIEVISVDHVNTPLMSAYS